MNLWKYIQGDKKGRDAHRIEREALEDPFLQDALDGFDAVKDNHIERIETLQRQVTIASRSSKRHLFSKWSIAASILLLISVGGYLFFTNKGEDKTLIAQQTHDTEIPEQILIQEEREDVKSVEEKSVQPPIIKAKEENKIKEGNKKRETPQIVQEISLSEAEEMLVADASIQSDTIIFIPMDELNALAAVKQTSPMQDSNLVRIRGKVTDDNGEPLIGASIVQKGTTNGAVSDMDGIFELKVKDPKGLTIQYIGYETLEIPAVRISDSMNIALHENTAMLEEVVVVGYTIQRKADVTSSVSVIEKENKKAKKSEPVIGGKAYENYLKENQIQPIDESGKPVKGKVKLSFHVNEQGRPENITVEKSLNDSANAEAIRLIEEGPDWTWSDKKANITIQF